MKPSYQLVRWFCLLLPWLVLVDGLWHRIRPSRVAPLEVAANAVPMAGTCVFLLAVLPWAHIGSAAYWAVLAALVLLVGLTVGAVLGARQRAALAAVRPRVVKVAWPLAWGGVLLGLPGYAVIVEALDRRTSHPVWIGFPLRDTWYASQGGRTVLFNTHNLAADQRYALDLVKIGSDGRPWRGNGRDAAANYAWDAPVYAPDEGVVVEARGDLPDNPVGVKDEVNLRGNYVLLERADGTLILLAHLRQGSLRVRVGDRVGAGQLLGRVGNSGRSSEPHLHLGVMRPEGGRLVGVPFGLADVEPGFVRPRRGSVLRKMPTLGRRGP